MIKKGTQERINVAVINYLNIISIWKGSFTDLKNPILLYFIQNFSNDKNINTINLTQEIQDIKIEDFNNMFNVDISYQHFHIIVKELYNVYLKLGEVSNNQDDGMKQLLIAILGESIDIDTYINNIIDQYKDSIYHIFKNYLSQNQEYNEMKINFLTDKMFEFAEKEEYVKAAEVRDIIKRIKKEGK